MSKSVEIRHSAGPILIRYSGHCQVFAEHLRRLVRIEAGKNSRTLIRIQFAPPCQKMLGEIRPQRQHIVSPMLRIRRQDSHRGLRIAQVERTPRQGGQLARPKSGAHSDHVEHGPFFGRHGAVILSGPSRRDETLQFIFAQRPSLMPQVGLDVLALQVGQRILGRPAVGNKPATELLDRLEVKVAGANTQTCSAAVGQIPLDLRSGYVGHEGEPAGGDDGPGPIVHEARVLVRIALVEQAGLVVVQMGEQRLLAVFLVPVDDPDLGLFGFALQLRRPLNRRRLVLEALDPLPDAIGVLVVDVPEPRLLPHLPAVLVSCGVFLFENACHNVTSSFFPASTSRSLASIPGPKPRPA
ncbi:MAG: hypothetical protein QM570_07430 [Planctomycetota bacterium]|nr:hypothetical protein [Planctomycetota bacterium]